MKSFESWSAKGFTCDYTNDRQKFSMKIWHNGRHISVNPKICISIKKFLLPLIVANSKAKVFKSWESVHGTGRVGKSFLMQESYWLQDLQIIFTQIIALMPTNCFLGKALCFRKCFIAVTTLNCCWCQTRRVLLLLTAAQTSVLAGWAHIDSPAWQSFRLNQTAKSPLSRSDIPLSHFFPVTVYSVVHHNNLKLQGVPPKSENAAGATVHPLNQQLLAPL